MSIKFSVYPWCENCSDFSPEVQVEQEYDTYGNQILCDTPFTCENEDRCVEIKKYLDSEIKGEIKMALAKKCDRCGKLYEHYPTGSKPQYNAIRRLYKTDDGGLMGSDNSIDLCPDCMKAFDEFMIRGKFGDE